MNGNTNLLLHLTGSVVYGYFGYALHTRVCQIETIYDKQFNHLFSELGKLRKDLVAQEAENTRLKRQVRKLNKMFWAYNISDAECMSATADSPVERVVRPELPFPFASLPIVELDSDIGYDSDPDPEIQDISPDPEMTTIEEHKPAEAEGEEELSEPEQVSPNDSVPEPAELSDPSEPLVETFPEPLIEHPSENVPEPLVEPPSESVLEPEPGNGNEETVVTNVVYLTSDQNQVIPPILKGDKIWNPASSRYILQASKVGKVLFANYLTHQVKE